MQYIELHTSSAFSFLEGSSLPEQLIAEAVRLDYPALALLDRDGVYGAPRFYRAAQEAGIHPIVGAEITAEDGMQLPLLVENRTGYQNLCRLITLMKLRAKKGAGEATLDEIEGSASGLVCLAGRNKNVLKSLHRLKQIFGPEHLFIELQRHFDRRQEEINQALIELGSREHLPLVATNGVRYAHPSGRRLLDVLTCVRHKTNLEEAGTLLNRNAECYLKSPEEMCRLFADVPQALASTIELSERLRFTLQDLGYRFPDYPTSNGESMMSCLRKLTEDGARRRYRPYHKRARQQIAHELNIIEKLDLAGYFLIVWDIVRFCRETGILAQGRGSAANSAVCYSLGITAVDPVGMDLLFERFLSEERGEWPDIDLDLPSGDRRERVIQYIYERYGKFGAGMTANVITYRGRSAAREVGKALGFGAETLDRLSKLLNTWGYIVPDGNGQPFSEQQFRSAGIDLSGARARQFMQLWFQIQDLPRHLGQHSGGIVMTQGRLDSVVPLENATMPGRVVVQWDKDDCADLGLIKVDLLGLGMMSVLQDSLQLIQESSGEEVDLSRLPQDDPGVYDLLQKADTVGVFQVESRAQMATLPRMKPRNFYDIVVEVAIIRPGPIVGQMVHPYLRRREGLESVSYPHPSLEPILKRTLGVPLFQEQLLRLAMVAAGFSGGEAEELRRAIGSKRSEERMRKIEVKLRQGMERNGITGEAAESIVRGITSFALYGFPESHAASFALIAYASAYLKVHYPAAFYAALLNNQPMGFYHPATLVKDAQHRGQRIKPIDIQKSGWLCTIEADGAIRLGLMYVAGLREDAGKAVERERHNGFFQSMDDLRRRAGLRKTEMTTLAEIGALNCFGMKRRQALWQVQKISRASGPLFDHLGGEHSSDSPLRDMTTHERMVADYAGMGLTLGPHPMLLKRNEMNSRGVLRAIDLSHTRDGQRVRVAGAVIVRQRPGTASGFIFLSLEDETGIANIIVHPQLGERERMLLVGEPFLMIEGVLQNQRGVVSVRAEKFWPIDGLGLAIASTVPDF